MSFTDTVVELLVLVLSSPKSITQNRIYINTMIKVCFDLYTTISRGARSKGILRLVIPTTNSTTSKTTTTTATTITTITTTATARH